MSQKRLCKDCGLRKESYLNRYPGEFDECKKVKQASLVSGEPKRLRWPYCEIQREDNWFFARLFGTCGKEARWFIPIRVVV